jgi:hypothetical protein
MRRRVSVRAYENPFAKMELATTSYVVVGAASPALSTADSASPRVSSALPSAVSAFAVRLRHFSMVWHRTRETVVGHCRRWGTLFNQWPSWTAAFSRWLVCDALDAPVIDQNAPSRNLFLFCWVVAALQLSFGASTMSCLVLGRMEDHDEGAKKGSYSERGPDQPWWIQMTINFTVINIWISPRL